MELIFLGTNGWYDDKTGNAVCAVLKTKKADIVLDAGNGIHKLDKYVDGTKPVYLFLSHYHLDHIAGLHVLVKFDLKKGLFICGQKGARRLLKGLLRRPFTVPLEKLRYKAEVLELPAELHKLPFDTEALPLRHADPVLGFRFNVDGKTVTYCTDTGWCENAVKLANGADLLISECSFESGEQNPAWPHLNPEIAALMAAQAGAKKLALTHFDAKRYTTASHRTRAVKAARKVFANTVAAYDGERIKI